MEMPGHFSMEINTGLCILLDRLMLRWQEYKRRLDGLAEVLLNERGRSVERDYLDGGANEKNQRWL